MRKVYFSLLVVGCLVLMLLTLTPVTAEAASRVKGYYKPKTGTYVQPHYRSSPNRSKIDNWSTKGNYNPFTGKKGYKSLFP